MQFTTRSGRRAVQGEAMAQKIRRLKRNLVFISDRRDDAQDASARLYYWLRIGLGQTRVYRDIESTGIGKWREIIDAKLARSAACVAVIGPRWAEPTNL